jgi:hypothetical protein
VGDRVRVETSSETVVIVPEGTEAQST